MNSIIGEIWKRVTNHPDYLISDHGRLWNTKKNKQIIGCNNRGNIQVRLNNSKTLRIHNLVAIEFVDDRLPEHTDIHHIDFNPSNNHWENLRWCTHKENMMYSGEVGRMSHPVKEETKIKISKTLTGTKKPEGFGEIIRQRRLGQKWSEENLHKMRKPRSEEGKLNMSIAAKNRFKKEDPINV